MTIADVTRPNTPTALHAAMRIRFAFCCETSSRTFRNSAVRPTPLRLARARRVAGPGGAFGAVLIAGCATAGVGLSENASSGARAGARLLGVWSPDGLRDGTASV